MLHLASQTDPGWGAWAVSHLDEILLDHAHCEKKAASSAMTLIFRYPDHPSLMVPLSQLAREELDHFERVVTHLRRRGSEFVKQKPSPYAAELMTCVRNQEPYRLLDTLLCCSLIEARSCERMQRLADALASGQDPDRGLLELYDDLLACEARHHSAYVDLARGVDVVRDAEIKRRLTEVAEHEASVVAAAPPTPRLHNAP